MGTKENLFEHAVQDTFKKLLVELYYNTCNCLRNDSSKDDLINPKFHEESCPYKEHAEKLNLEFIDE